MSSDLDSASQMRFSFTQPNMLENQMASVVQVIWPVQLRFAKRKKRFSAASRQSKRQWLKSPPTD